MPTYQYRCAKCGEQFELWHSIHDDALQKHPGCGGSVTKVMAPAGIVLKGSGFYRTDSRKESAGTPAAKESSGTGSSSSKESAGSSSSSSSSTSSPAPAASQGSASKAAD
jgi:putative FmdB family regulatory protein